MAAAHLSTKGLSILYGTEPKSLIVSFDCDQGFGLTSVQLIMCQADRVRIRNGQHRFKKVVVQLITKVF